MKRSIKISLLLPILSVLFFNSVYAGELSESANRAEILKDSDPTYSYVVEYWTQNLDGDPLSFDESNYSRAAQVTYTTSAFGNVTPQPTTISGFKTPTVQTWNFTEDGEHFFYYYTRRKYFLTINVTEGIDSVTGGGEYYYEDMVTLSANTKPGYSFSGWTGDLSTKLTPVTFKYSTTRDVSIIANASIETYQITYYLDGGLNWNVNPTTYKCTDSVVLKDPVKEGYYFEGWYLDKDFTEKIDTIGAGRAGNLNLYAKWLKKTRSLDVEYEEPYQRSGTAIDRNKMKIVSYLSNGTKEEIDPTNEGVKLSKEWVDFGKNVITVEYDGGKGSFTVSSNVLTLLKGEKYTVSGMGKLKGEKGYKATSTNKKAAKLTKKGVAVGGSAAGEATLTALRGDGSTQEFYVYNEVPKWKKRIKMAPQGYQNVEMRGTEQKVTYSSGDQSIATVDKYGNVYGRSEGKTVIYTTINNRRYRTTVSVKKPEQSY